MKRSLYELLLGLHPREFRERFAAEMTLNFEEGAAAERSIRLLLDGLTSLLRQWFLRSAWWKLMAAVVCATLQMMMIFSFSWRLPAHGHYPARIAVSLAGDQHGVGLLIVGSTTFIVVLATVTALWVRSLVAERAKGKGGRRYSAI